MPRPTELRPAGSPRARAAVETPTTPTPASNVVATGAAAPPVRADDGVRPIPPATANRPDEMMLMQYNVENLFDTVDDPKKQDEDFTPQGRERWTDEKLSFKLQNMGRVVRGVNGGRGPDILALQEVENKQVLDQLNRGALRGLGYREPILLEGQDARGIDVALITRYPLAGQPKIHDISDPSWRGPSRPVLEVPLDVDGREVTVFVNHWPSKGGGAQAEVERAAAGDRLRQLVSDKLRRDPDAEVLAVGDFNSDLGEAPLRDHLRAAADPTEAARSSAEAPVLYDAMYDAAQHGAGHQGNITSDAPPLRSGDLKAEISARRAVLATATRPAPSGNPDEAGKVGTHYYKKDNSWSTLDHVVMSRGLLDAKGLSYVPGSAQVVHDDDIENRDGSPKRFMPPPRRGDQERGLPPPQVLGYSDHFPVVARFKRQRD